MQEFRNHQVSYEIIWDHMSSYEVGMPHMMVKKHHMRQKYPHMRKPCLIWDHMRSYEVLLVFCVFKVSRCFQKSWRPMWWVFFLGGWAPPRPKKKHRKAPRLNTWSQHVLPLGAQWSQGVCVCVSVSSFWLTSYFSFWKKWDLQKVPGGSLQKRLWRIGPGAGLVHNGT